MLGVSSEQTEATAAEARMEHRGFHASAEELIALSSPELAAVILRLRSSHTAVIDSRNREVHELHINLAESELLRARERIDHLELVLQVRGQNLQDLIEQQVRERGEAHQ